MGWVPMAVAVKVAASSPSRAVRETGWRMKTGATGSVLTVKMALELVTEAVALLTITE